MCLAWERSVSELYSVLYWSAAVLSRWVVLRPVLYVCWAAKYSCRHSTLMTLNNNSVILFGWLVTSHHTLLLSALTQCVISSSEHPLVTYNTLIPLILSLPTTIPISLVSYMLNIANVILFSYFYETKFIVFILIVLFLLLIVIVPVNTILEILKHYKDTIVKSSLIASLLRRND